MKTKRPLLGAALIIVLGILWWSTPEGVDATRSFADHLPAETLATFTLEELPKHLDNLAELREDLPSDDPVSTVLQALDARWLDESTWESFGLDLSEPVGMAILARPLGVTVLSLSIHDVETVKAGLPKLMDALQMTPDPKEHTFGDVPGMVLVPGEWGMLLYERRAVVFGGTEVGEVKGATSPEEGLLLLGERLADLHEDERLSADEHFALEGTTLDDTPLVMWVNPFRLRKVFTDTPLAYLRTWLRKVRSLAISSARDGDTLTLSARAVMEDPEDAQALFGGEARDLSAWDHIPGPMLGAFHATLAPDAVMAAAQSITDGILGEGTMEEVIDDLESELGLDLAHYGRAFTGEMGYLITGAGDGDGDGDEVLGNQTAFATLSDEASVRKGLRKLARMLVDEGVEVDREIEDEAIMYSVQLEGTSFGAAIFEGKLWISLNPDQLEDMIEGRGSSAWADDRAAEVMAPLKGDEAVVSVWDTRQLGDALETIPGLTEIMPGWMWRGLDRTSFSMSADDGVLTGTLHVTLGDDAHPIFEAIGGLLANPMVLGIWLMASMEIEMAGERQVIEAEPVEPETIAPAEPEAAE